MFSNYIINIETTDCSSKVNMRLLPLGHLYRVTFPKGTEIVGSYSNVVSVPSPISVIFDVSVSTNTDVIIDFVDNNSDYLIQITDDVTVSIFTYVVELECLISELTTTTTIVTSVIPNFHSYSDLYFQVKLALRIHAKMTHRLSNDVMFVGYNERIKELYSQLSKLWVLSDTLLELMKDNPIFDCDEVMSGVATFNSDIDENLYNKYMIMFNNLFNCLKTTIDYIDKRYKKGLTISVLKENCEEVYNTGDPSDDTSDCIIGDYNNDYNNDYYNLICNEPLLREDLIVCDTVYDIVTISGSNVTLSDTFGLSIGDRVELGNDTASLFDEETIVLTITNIVGNVLTLNMDATGGYTKLMIIGLANYLVVLTPSISDTDFANSRYLVKGDITSSLVNNSAIKITSISNNKYYDVITSFSYDAGTDYTRLNVNLVGVLKASISTFEITDFIVNSSNCNIPSGSLVYAGVSASSILNATEIKALTDVYEYRTTYIGSYPFSITGYKYFAWPDSFGGANDFIAAGTDIAMYSGYSNVDNGFTYELVTIDGVSYRLYRTSYIIGSSLNAEVS